MSVCLCLCVRVCVVFFFRQIASKRGQLAWLSRHVLQHIGALYFATMPHFPDTDLPRSSRRTQSARTAMRTHTQIRLHAKLVVNLEPRACFECEPFCTGVLPFQCPWPRCTLSFKSESAVSAHVEVLYQPPSQPHPFTHSFTHSFTHAFTRAFTFSRGC